MNLRDRPGVTFSVFNSFSLSCLLFLFPDILFSRMCTFELSEKLMLLVRRSASLPALIPIRWLFASDFLVKWANVYLQRRLFRAPRAGQFESFTSRSIVTTHVTFPRHAEGDQTIFSCPQSIFVLISSFEQT